MHNKRNKLKLKGGIIANVMFHNKQLAERVLPVSQMFKGPVLYTVLNK